MCAASDTYGGTIVMLAMYTVWHYAFAVHHWSFNSVFCLRLHWPEINVVAVASITDLVILSHGYVTDLC